MKTTELIRTSKWSLLVKYRLQSDIMGWEIAMWTKLFTEINVDSGGVTDWNTDTPMIHT